VDRTGFRTGITRGAGAAGQRLERTVRPSAQRRRHQRGNGLEIRCGGPFTFVAGSLAPRCGCSAGGCANGLGSVRQQLDSSGIVESVNSYRPFGLPLEGNGGDPYGFTGEWFEDQVELLFLRERYYDPGTGRFLSQDPWRGNMWRPGTLQPFVYVENNPINGIDPSGLRCLFFKDNCDVIAKKVERAATRVVVPYVGGFSLEFLDRELFGLPRLLFPSLFDIDNNAFILGRYGGRGVSDALSMLELAVGAGCSTGGLAASSTGFGALVGIPAEALGLGLVAHGTLVFLRPTEPLPLAYFSEAGQAGEGSGLPEAIDPPASPGGLRRAMGQPPPNMSKPQAHHNLPWKFRAWFAGRGRGLNVNDPQFGRWVEGTPPGEHQRWTSAYNMEWERFIQQNPSATRPEVLDFMNQLLSSGRFP
jgi:RHS repeat-associated protein